MTTTSISRSGWWSCSAALLSVSLSLSCAGGASSVKATSPAADLVLVGGKVYTMDPLRREAEAVAVKDGLVAFVGSAAEARALVGPATRVVDLAGRAVTPGLVDGHCHLYGLGHAMENLALRGLGSPEAVAAKVAEQAGKVGAGEWILGRGWDQNLWTPQAFPGHALLDAAAPDHPVLLRRRRGGGGLDWRARDGHRRRHRRDLPGAGPGRAPQAPRLRAARRGQAGRRAARAQARRRSRRHGDVRAARGQALRRRRARLARRGAPSPVRRRRREQRPAPGHARGPARRRRDRGARGLAASRPRHRRPRQPQRPRRLRGRPRRGGPAWRSLLDSGAHLAFGSDFPVEETAPLLGVYAAVTRQDAQGNPPGGFLPGQRLTLEEALRAFTVEPAWAAFQEGRHGRLVPGQVADLTVYDRDLGADRSLLETRIDLTIVGGRIVYDRHN